MVREKTATFERSKVLFFLYYYFPNVHNFLLLIRVINSVKIGAIKTWRNSRKIVGFFSRLDRHKHSDLPRTQHEKARATQGLTVIKSEIFEYKQSTRLVNFVLRDLLRPAVITHALHAIPSKVFIFYLCAWESCELDTNVALYMQIGAHEYLWIFGRTNARLQLIRNSKSFSTASFFFCSRMFDAFSDSCYSRS